MRARLSYVMRLLSPSASRGSPGDETRGACELEMLRHLPFFRVEMLHKNCTRTFVRCLPLFTIRSGTHWRARYFLLIASRSTQICLQLVCAKDAMRNVRFSYHRHTRAATPVNAIAVTGECSFDRNLCGWKNLTKNPLKRDGQLSASLGSSNKVASLSARSQAQQAHPLGHRLSSQGESITWRLASPNSRPANLQDHTFRAPSECCSSVWLCER